MLVRAVTFISVLTFLTRKTKDFFPLPFTWIFKDLSKFIFEPMCLKVFRDYLDEKERGKSEYLDEIMQIYISSGHHQTKSQKSKSMRPASVGSNLMSQTRTTKRKVFMEYIQRLGPSFNRFKRTVAYHHLYMKVKEFEEISEKVYQTS